MVVVGESSVHENEHISLYVGCILVYIPSMLSLLFWVTAVCDINVVANFGRLSVRGHDMSGGNLSQNIFHMSRGLRRVILKCNGLRMSHHCALIKPNGNK